MIKKLIAGVIGLCVIGAVIVFISEYIDKVKVNNLETFSIAKYEYYVDNFSSDTVLGKVADIDTAVQNAENVWIEMYGIEVKKEKPYKVAWDAQSGTWHVYGSLSSDIFVGSTGGVAHILIRKSDGKVFAVWHQK